MYDSTSTRDNVAFQPEQPVDGSIRLADEANTASAVGNASDGVQATQQLVDAGQVPALEIVSSSSSESFNAMISTDGLTVVNVPGRGQTDYFAKVDGMDDQGYIWNGEDGAITKTGIDSFIAEADAAPRGRFINPSKDAYVDSLRHLSENWYSPEMTPYKETQDSMTRESFAAGLESLPLRQEQAVSEAEQLSVPIVEGVNAEQAEAAPVESPIALPADASSDAPVEVSAETPVEIPVSGPVDMPAGVPVETETEVPAESPAESPTESPVDGPVDKPAEAPAEVPTEVPAEVPTEVPAEAPAATLALSEEAAELSHVRLGEGPYQVAERVLSAGDSATSHDEVMALVRAMQAQYREEYPEDPNLASLKVNHQFISPEKLDSLLNSISDPLMRDSIAAKLLTPTETAAAETAGTDSATTEDQSDSHETVSAADQLNAVIEREAFNTMISTHGPVVFGAPASGATDYFSEVDRIDLQATAEEQNDGAITKSDIDNFLSESVANNDMSTSSGDPARDQFVESLKQFSANWDNPEMAPYKDAQGAITRESFAAGIESLPQRQEQVAAEKDALSLPAYEDNAGTEQETNQTEVAPLILSEEAAELSQVRSGEGAYQVAARILASGGSAASNSEVTALMRAMQAQYRQENPDDANMAGLKQGHQLLTTESVTSVLANISDPILRASIEAKITQQDS